MSSSAALLSGVAATAVLVACHLAVPAFRRKVSPAREALVASIGGGVAVAYVFLHLLPEVARGNRAVAEVLGERVSTSAVSEVALFAVALAGFVLLYGLDHLATRRSEAGTESAGVFAVHLGAFSLYNAMITYTLPIRFEDGRIGFAVLFVVAMALHFLLSDRALAEHHGDLFARVGRPVLAAALVVGIVASWLAAPTRTVVVSVVAAALAGFVLFNVVRDEIPGEQRVRFPAFLGAITTYGALMLALAGFHA